MPTLMRSLRFQLISLYILVTLAWMSFVGVFTYLYLRHALEASRAETMVRREQRLIHYVNDAHAHLPGLSLQETLRFFREASSTPNDLVQIFDSRGHLMFPLDSTPAVRWPGSECTQACFGEIMVDGHRMRTIQHQVMLDGAPALLCMAGSMDEHYQMIQHVVSSYWIAAPLTLLASVAAAVLLIRRAMRAVDRITKDARTIGIHDLKRRLPVAATGDEMQRLTETWNELLERLDLAVSRLRQFTSDVSHDLRTSTTVMLATAQVSLRQERTAKEYKAALTTVVLECEATSQMLDDLLTGGTADLNTGERQLLPLALQDVVEEVCESMQARAELRQQKLVCHSEQQGWILGDLATVRRLTTILLDNASKYTSSGGLITIGVSSAGGDVLLRVRDSGIGITPEDMPRIFDRFFRADSARPHAQGRGLGLAIASRIAENHGAHIEVSSEPGKGTEFSIRFPSYVPETQAPALAAQQQVA